MKFKNNFGPILREVNGTLIFGELEDIEHVEERRAAIGLMTVGQQCKVDNSQLPFNRKSR
jgi:hypothetical protein